MLSKEEMHRLGHQLKISANEMESHFTDHSASIVNAVHQILITWLRSQSSCREAYIHKCEALTHKDVRLNLIANDELGFTSISQIHE